MDCWRFEVSIADCVETTFSTIPFRGQGSDFMLHLYQLKRLPVEASTHLMSVRRLPKNDCLYYITALHCPITLACEYAKTSNLNVTVAKLVYTIFSPPMV